MYPSEVEAALRALPDVRQAFVTDVPGEGEMREVAALVVARDADLAALTAAARARLSAFKVPTLWLLASAVDEVPTMATGKVDKSALQAALMSRGVRL